MESFLPYLRVAHPHGRPIDLERHEESLDGAADLAQRRSLLRRRCCCSVLLAGGGEEVELSPELGVPNALREAVLVQPNGVENLSTPKLKHKATLAQTTISFYKFSFPFTQPEI